MALFAASVDTPELNADFAKSLGLDYPILSDPGKEVAKACGVLTADGAYARRHTLYIGADGKVLYIDTAVKPATAGADVAARLAALGVAKREPKQGAK